MTEEYLSEKHCNWVRQDLNLIPGRLIFELNEEESENRPDDWAWSFLRLNDAYQKAYKSYSLDQCDELFHALDEQRISGIKADHDGSCAREFGLSAWLPPSLQKLPTFRQENDSWFFSLKRPISEDYRRLEVGKDQYRRPWTRYTPHLDKFPHILANEDLFGYRPPPSVPIPTFALTRSPQISHRKYIKAPAPFDASTIGLIWGAIDCSIPVNGQVSALSDLAQIMRSALMAEKWITKKRTKNVAIQSISESDAFSHMNFSRAEKPSEKVSDLKTVWRAVMIDSLAPIGRQRKFLLGELKNVHMDLIAKGLAQEPRSLRFKNKLSFSHQNQAGKTVTSSGGSYLKALLVLAQLSQKGYTDPTEVAQIIGLHSVSGRYVAIWATHFENDLGRYIQVAQDMIRDGYRHLVHEQKPDI